MTSLVRDEIADKVAELRGDAASAELLSASVESNVDTILHALQHRIAVDRITAPAAAVEYARRLAQHRVPVNALVRGYRLGQRRLTELIFVELESLNIDPLARVATIQKITRVTFEYIDSVTQQVVAVYEDERERWVENQHSIRTLKVRELLAEDTVVDAEATSVDIRYPLRWHHVALIVGYPETDDHPDQLSRLHRFVRDLGARIEVGGNPLFAPVDAATAWVWLPYRSLPTAPVERIRAALNGFDDPPHMSLGSAGSGIEGFRRSHRRAWLTWELGRAHASRTPITMAVDDPGVAIAALLAANGAMLRDWVGEVLGPLAANTDNDARLRDTLRVFLCAGSYKLAAEELNMHFNSVKYRVDRALHRRGKPIRNDRLDVEVALLVCRWYGPAVLLAD
ncbi:PucR family transcriptional regulator [Mycolicibacterium sarraceniae]|uniref:PucR family transcriptional regulator n=1 Tax=Mycolicibacterium sarraceniae TaxID=1534348 RepID=UPI001F1D1B6F|nr:helix-turn-helix domain-containing protein [Mycolicibacterium sarraceniae]